jgi:hypothetical protein
MTSSLTSLYFYGFNNYCQSMVSEVVKVPEIKKGICPLFVDLFNFLYYDRAFYYIQVKNSKHFCRSYKAPLGKCRYITHIKAAFLNQTLSVIFIFQWL